MKGEISMIIKLAKTTYFLGEAIPVEITYDNNTSETLVMENPSKSFEVLMHLVDTKCNEDFKFTMGILIVTVIDRKTREYVDVMPEIEQIEIAPKSSFLFTSDLNDRLSLYAGEFDCFLTDGDNESNHIKLNIRYTIESVNNLLKLAQNKEATYGRREWAMEWLQELYPNFKLRLSLEEDSDDIKIQNETYNKSIYNEFLNWWDDKKDSVNIEEMLKRSRQDML